MQKNHFTQNLPPFHNKNTQQTRIEEKYLHVIKALYKKNSLIELRSFFLLFELFKINP